MTMQPSQHDASAPRRFRGALATLLLGCLAAAGCGGAPQQSSVSGTVTFDGEPIANGLIRFVPADPAQKQAEGVITAGKYAVAPPAGEHRVEISAAKVVGKKKMYDTPDSPTIDVTTELLPPRYHAQSELKMTVVPGDQAKDFTLTSK